MILKNPLALVGENRSFKRQAIFDGEPMVGDLIQLVFDIDLFQPRSFRGHVINLRPYEAPNKVGSIQFNLLAKKQKAVHTLPNRLWDLELEQFRSQGSGKVHPAKTIAEYPPRQGPQNERVHLTGEQKRKVFYTIPVEKERKVVLQRINVFVPCLFLAVCLESPWH